ncbi:MAG: MarR family winged helix-turn-helix transcriptional regulator [Bacillota bacterium]|nr:MarR family winged helix-turn-helix transcriptional regulator [Bacillota bacterium]
MLEEAFCEVYTKFKMQFYSKIFKRFQHREASLTAVETFCVEAIYALDRPTVNEFATFTQISPSNATYKINNLVKKGYIRKVRSEEDKREYYLEVTDKFLAYYGITYDYISLVVDRITKRFPQQDIDKFNSMLEIISNELMPEVVMGKNNK